MFPVSKYGQSYAIYYGTGFQTNTESVCTNRTHYLNNSHLAVIYSQYFIQKIYCIIQFISYLFNNEAVFVCAISLIKAISLQSWKKQS